MAPKKVAASAAPKSYSQLQHFHSPPWKFAELPRPRVGLGHVGTAWWIQKLGFGWFSSKKHGSFHVLIHHILCWLLCLWCVACVFLNLKNHACPRYGPLAGVHDPLPPLGLPKKAPEVLAGAIFKTRSKSRSKKIHLKYLNKPTSCMVNIHTVISIYCINTCEMCIVLLWTLCYTLFYDMIISQNFLSIFNFPLCDIIEPIVLWSLSAEEKCGALVFPKNPLCVEHVSIDPGSGGNGKMKTIIESTTKIWHQISLDIHMYSVGVLLYMFF